MRRERRSGRKARPQKGTTAEKGKAAVPPNILHRTGGTDAPPVPPGCHRFPRASVIHGRRPPRVPSSTGLPGATPSPSSISAPPLETLRPCERFPLPSSCPSPSGEGTRGRRALLGLAHRPSRRWHLRSGHGRTCRAKSLPRRRENKREGQPARTLRATTGAAPRSPRQDSEPTPRSVSIPSSCPSPSGEGTRRRRSLRWFRYRPSRR